MEQNRLDEIYRYGRSVVSLASCVILTLIVAGISGCSKRYHELPAFASYPVYDTQNNSVGRFKTSYLADQIHAYFRGNISGPIAVATLVDVDNLYGSSTFGRLLTEQLISELSMRGYNVIELRQSGALQVAMGEGEFALSRELELMQQEQAVSGLVVGTYAVSPIRVYVNVRIVDPSTALVISAGSVEMKKTKELVKLLRNNSYPTSLERIPVRHLSYQARYPQHFFPYEQRLQPEVPYIDWNDKEMFKDNNTNSGMDSGTKHKNHNGTPKPHLGPTA